jgi:putative cofactor-binding repeat protein
MRRLATLIAAAAVLIAAAPAGAATCTRIALPMPGAATTMVAALQPGQTGCLAGGVHAGDVAIRRPDVVLRAVPGEHATLRGQVYVAAGAPRVTVTGLVLDGTNPRRRPSPVVNADDATFTGNDVSNQHETCFVLGDPVWGVPSRTRIAGNLIHDCGVPNTNLDHGIYVRHAIGTVIEGNVIRNNPDRGVQLFPNADATIVRGNLITGNGEGVIFSGNGAEVSEDNLVERNIISRSRLRWDAESFWTTRAGTGNLLVRNCVYGGRRGAVQRPAIGFRAQRNVHDPDRCRIRAPRLDLPHAGS